MLDKPTYEALEQRVAVLENRLQQLEYYDLFFDSLTDGAFFMMLDEPLFWNNDTDKEAALDYIFTHQRVTRFNDEILKQNQVSAEKYRGLTPQDFFKHDIAHGRALWRRFLDQGVWTLTQELMGVGNQQPLIVKATYKAIYDAEGRFCGHFGVCKDITEQTQRAEKLQEVQAFNEVVFNSLDANICVLDRDGNIIHTNQAWKDFATENEGDFTKVDKKANYLHVCVVRQVADQKSARDKEEAEKAQRGINAVLEGKQDHFQLQYPCHGNNKERWFLMNVRALAGDTGGAVVSHVNVTPLKKAYDKIHDNEENMRLVTQALHLAVYQFVSQEGVFVRFEFVSEGMKALFQQNIEVHTLDDFAQHVTQSYQHKFYESLHQALKHQTPWMIEFPMKVSSSEEKWVWMQAYPETTFNNKVHWNGLLMDITSRKELNQHLQLQDAIIRHLNDAVLVTEAEPFDEPGPRVLYVNPTFTQMTGYTLEEIKGKTPRILQGEKTSKAIRAKMRQAFKNWEPIEVELINYTKSGEEFWVHISIMPLANEVGWYTHWVSVQKDITERKRQEDKLKASEIKYKTLFEEAPLGVLIIDPDTKKPVEFNEKAAAMLGYTKEEFQELGLLDYVDVSADELAQVVTKLDQQPVYTVEKSLTEKTGGKKHVLASIKKIVIDKKELIFSLRLDLTHQKQLETQQKLFFETSLDLLAMINFEGYFVKLNKAWETTLGYTLEEMQSHPFAYFLHSDDVERSVNEAASLQEGGTVVAFINRYRHKNGQYIWLEWNAISMPDEQLLYTSARDITAEIEAKEALKINEAKYKALFDESLDGVLLFDSATWQPFEFNDKVIDILGYPREIFQKMSLNQYLVDYPEQAQINAVANEVKKSASLELEVRMKHHNGSIRIVQVKIKYLELALQKVFFNIWTDITERKAAIEKVRINEERFRMAIDSSLDAFYILEAYYNKQGEVVDFVFVDSNEVGKQQLDFIEVGIIGQQLCEILPINREQGFFERYKKVFLTGETLDDEFPIELEGYAPQWLHYTVVKLANGVAITARDITERKIASNNIRISEERFRSAIDSSLDAFYILEAFYDEQGEVTDFVFVDMNEVGKQQLSFLKMEVIGQQMCEILPINREQGFFDRYKKVFLTGETLDDEFPISVEGYAPQWLHHTVVKLANGVAITARDVTVRKTATEKVKVSEERFRSAIDNSLDGFYILDAHYGKSRKLTDFIFVDSNKAGLSFINLPPDQVIGQKLCEILPINREQGFFDKYKRVFLTGETLDEEVLLQDVKLNLTWVHHTVVRLKRGIAITTRDIRLRKEHEEQISVANLQLREQQAQMQDLLAEITASEQKFRSLAENIKDVFLVFKNDAIEYVSPAYKEVWQQSVESLYNDNHTLLEAIHPDDKERVVTLYNGEHYRKTGHFSEEFRLVRKDQSICWVFMRTFPVVVTETVFHVVGIAKDITARKATEEELRVTNEELGANKQILEEALEKLVQSESSLKALFDSSDQGIVFLDTDLRIISFNKAVNLYHSHLEQTPLELGDSIFDHLFNAAHLKDAYQDKLQACLEGKVIMFERQFNYPDISNLRWVETSLYPVHNHKREIIGVALNEKDITAQRHIALRLRKSEIRLRGILNNTIQAFFLLDRHKSLLLCNTAAIAYVRLVFNKDLKVGEDFTDLISDEDKEAFEQRFSEALNGHRFTTENEVVLADGSTRWFDINYAPVDSVEGNRDMVVFSTLDITARKEAQEREKKLLQEQIHSQLEQEALKRSAILEGQEKESHRISRELHDSVGQMLSALSYHLNDLETMLKDQRSANAEPAGFEKIDVTAERAKVLLKEVIQEVREISHNLMPKILTDYGLIEALKQLRVDFASVVNIPINLDIFCESDRFDDNIEISIFRITQEAVNNILKYANATEVNIQLIEHDTNLQLLVEDNGVGFSLTKVKAKSGNGLINMEERAKLVGGALSIDTEINKGTCIMVEIPLGHFGNG